MTLTENYPINGKRPQILCVDSDVAGLVLLDAILSPRGYDVIRVNTGQEAIDVLQRQSVDLILLGVVLAGMDGFEVCREIRSHGRFGDIPVIMMSALKARQDLLRGIEAGADAYLFKPLDHEEMLALVRGLLRRKYSRDSLTNSYENMHAMNMMSQEGIHAFLASSVSSPFDFQVQMDKILALLVGKATDIVDKPRTVIIGFMPDHKNWQWFHYEYAFHELNRVKLDFQLLAGIALPERGKSKTFLLNDSKAFEESKALIRNFQARNMSVENGIGFLSREFCLLAINYGQEVAGSHVRFVQQVALAGQFLNTLSQQYSEVGRAFDYMVYALCRIAEAYEEETPGHIYRVGEYCGILAERLGMKESLIHAISTQALLHDVGKIFIPAYILKKTDPLTAEEALEFRKHTLWGAKIIGGDPHLQIGQSMALNHHEKWDGSGYPRGLKGEAIPIEARIAALADQYDTLRMAQRRKASVDHATATKILNQGDGRIKPQHFDPQILKAYRETAFLFEDVYERRKD